MFNSRQRMSDLQFALDILALAVGAARCCLYEGQLEEAEKFVTLASHSIYQRINDESLYDFDIGPIDRLYSRFMSCCSSLFVLNALSLYHLEKHSEVLVLLGSIKENPVDLDSDQSDVLSRTCFNIALKIFNCQNYEDSVVWLKFAHSFGRLHFKFGTSFCLN